MKGCGVKGCGGEGWEDGYEANGATTRGATFAGFSFTGTVASGTSLTNACQMLSSSSLSAHLYTNSSGGLDKRMGRSVASVPKCCLANTSTLPNKTMRANAHASSTPWLKGRRTRSSCASCASLNSVPLHTTCSRAGRKLTGPYHALNRSFCSFASLPSRSGARPRVRVTRSTLPPSTSPGAGMYVSSGGGTQSPPKWSGSMCAACSTGVRLNHTR